MIEVTVQSLGLDPSSNTPVVILREQDGTRVLPIWIGPGEASAIAMELAGMTFSRPLTHDLFASMIRGLGGSLERVMITRVEENTYYAEMILRRGDEVFSVDARPSDSIAVALRLDATIYASDELLEDTTIEVAEASGGTFDPDSAAGKGEDESPQGLSADELKEYLRRMHPEDFGRFTP